MTQREDEPATPAEELAGAIVDMINAQHTHYSERDRVQLDRFDKLVRAIERALTPSMSGD
jgi:hypothetical protein